MYPSAAESTPTDSPRPSTPGTENDTLFDHESRQTTDDQYVLVTGGLGFIGSHTSLELLKVGYKVIIVDNLSNSFRDVFSRIMTIANRHFDNCGGQCPELEFHKIGYQDTNAMRALLETHCSESLPGKKRSNIIGVIHFAAFKAVEESIRQPLKYYQNNINGLVNFMTLLDEYGIKTFVFSSSAAVYGDLADGSRLLREEHCVHDNENYQDIDGTERPTKQSSWTSITSPYGRTKFFGEAILSDLVTSDPSWTIAVLRYFNPIGCDASGLLGEDPRGVPSNLLPVVVKVLTGQYQELSVYGSDWATPDGTAVRDFIHVTDLARGHAAVLSAIRAGRIRRGYHTFNLGTGTGYSVLEIVAAMEFVSGCSIPRKMVSRRAGDVPSSVAAVDRARLELEWETKKSLTDACRDIWNYLKVSGAYSF